MHTFVLVIACGCLHVPYYDLISFQLNQDLAWRKDDWTGQNELL